MIEALRVFNSAPLSDAELRELGRVNVICGRNNSGKTTLLSAIESSERSAIGRRMEDNDFAALDQVAKKVVPGNMSIAPLLTRAVRKTVTSKERWFGNDLAAFLSGLQQGIDSESQLSRWSINTGILGQELIKRIGKRPSFALIPPKRIMPLLASIHTSENLTSSGAGLLNSLFYAKSQNLRSPERIKFDRIIEAFEYISSGFSFDISPNKSNEILLRFAFKSQNWIKAEACGLGLQDLLVLLYFGIADDAEVLLIEEPESHLHPEMQRRLLGYLRDQTEKQLFVTTHSNVFLDNALIDRVFFTTFSDGAIQVDDETSRASILDDLGYSVTDNLVSDLVILVEGPTDVPIVEEFLRKLNLLGRYNIKLWPLGGDIMDQLDLSVFAERYKLIALIDKDPDSAAVRKRFEKKCKEAGVPVHKLSRYSIENYFTLPALRQVFGSQIPAALAQIDPDQKMEKQLGLSVKKNNRSIAKAMSLDDIEGTDLRRFLQKVEKMLQ